MELVFQRMPGVVDTCVGYCQGSVEHPSYEAVCSGKTGHTEAVQLTFDPNQVCSATFVFERKILFCVRYHQGTCEKPLCEAVCALAGHGMIRLCAGCF